jgi:hypothetical protein
VGVVTGGVVTGGVVGGVVVTGGVVVVGAASLVAAAALAAASCLSRLAFSAARPLIVLPRVSCVEGGAGVVTVVWVGLAVVVVTAGWDGAEGAAVATPPATSPADAAMPTIQGLSGDMRVPPWVGLGAFR